MIGPTTRVLALLELLQTRDIMSGADIAERLGVDRRTVRRYISILEELGIPITTEHGRYGGYKVVPGFKLPPLMFTESEMRVIMLALLAVHEHNFLDDAVALSSVKAKLERVVPEYLKAQIQAMDNTIQLLPSGQPTNHEQLLELTRAIQAKANINMLYKSPKGEIMQRQFNPYGLVHRTGKWYVSGFCHLRQALRSFRLDRLSDISCTGTYFERPTNFDAAQYLQESMHQYMRGQPVNVLFDTDMTSLTTYLTSVMAYSKFVEDMLVQDENGVLLTTNVDNFHWFALWLAGLPFSFVIKSPDELKTEFNNHVQKLLLAM